MICYDSSRLQTYEKFGICLKQCLVLLPPVRLCKMYPKSMGVTWTSKLPMLHFLMCHSHISCPENRVIGKSISLIKDIVWENRERLIMMCD